MAVLRPTRSILICAALLWCSARLLGASSGAEMTGAQPQLAVTNDGRVWLTFGQATEVRAARSDDGGRTFSSPAAVADVPGLMLGRRRGPRIGAVGERVTVTVIDRESGNVLAFHSADSGRSWSGPRTVNDVPTSAREGLHDLAAAPDGRMFVTWLDLRAGKTELYGAESRDGGRTWGANERIYVSPDKSICECCHPSALFDDAGNLAVMWRNSIGGKRDMWLATRARDAKAFSSATKLGTAEWELKACPMDGGDLAARGDGRFDTVWQRAGEVFFSGPDGPETRLGKGMQPVAAVSGGDSTVVVWQSGSSLVHARLPDAPEPKSIATPGKFPVLGSLPDGGVVVAYESGANILVQRL